MKVGIWKPGFSASNSLGKIITYRIFSIYRPARDSMLAVVGMGLSYPQTAPLVLSLVKPMAILKAGFCWRQLSLLAPIIADLPLFYLFEILPAIASVIGTVVHA